MIVTCDNCGKRIHKKRNYVEKRTKHSFCSRKCYGEYKERTGLGRKVKKNEESERAVLMRLEGIAKKGKNNEKTWEVINA
jgi:hypothetical protein